MPPDINTKIRFNINAPIHSASAHGKHLQGVTKLQTDTIIHGFKSDITPSSNVLQASTHLNSSVFATVASYQICDSPVDPWEEKT